MNYKRFWIMSAFALLVGTVQAQSSTLNVTSFGARGDAVSFRVNTVSNSTAVSAISDVRFSSADVGKIIEIFGVGPTIMYNSNFITTNQDMICFISGVSNGTNLTISVPAGRTVQSALAIAGSQNALAFQAAVDAASGTNTIIQIPEGKYLLISTQALDPNFVMQGNTDTRAAVTLRKGGIRFVGTNADTTILYGCGAGVVRSCKWSNPPFCVYRGTLFLMMGPVTNNYPVSFENLTMDGGVTNGLTSDHWFPPATINGDGWDMTHGAVLEGGQPPLYCLKEFINCRIQHWRGEMFKSVTGQGIGSFIRATNCVFFDGNASAWNFTFSHQITHCSFSNLVKILELYQSYCDVPSVLEDCYSTNIVGNVIAIVGATTNSNPAAYTIRNNVFDGVNSSSAVLFSPAQNVTVSSNTFSGQGTGVSFSAAGLQPQDGSAAIMSNIVIACNNFKNIFLPICTDGYPARDVLVVSNSAQSTYAFAIGSGWKTNFVFRANTAAACLDSRTVSGEVFNDDPSNNFRPYSEDTDWVGKTNKLLYTLGRRHQIYTPLTNSVFCLDASDPTRIPQTAQMEITQAGPVPVRVYSSQNITGTPLLLAPGKPIRFFWSAKDSTWTTNDPSQTLSTGSRLLPPAGLRVLPTP